MIDGRLFRFHEFLLDPIRRSLTFEGRDVDLRPKSFDVLCALLSKAGEVVSKDELIRHAWPGLVVTDDSLTQCIGDIRRALGERGPRLVRTAPRRGYSFAAPVQRLGPAQQEPESAGASAAVRPARLVRREAIVAGLCVAGAAATGVAWISGKRPAVSEQPSIVVIPFTNPSGDPEQRYFCDGLGEEVTARLSQFRDVVVIAHNSALAYRDKPTDPRRIGADLGVRYILEGSVRREPARVRVRVRLVDAETGVERWAETFDGELARLAELQDELTQSIVGALVGRVSVAEIERSLHKDASSLAAYDHYLRGKASLQLVDAAATPLIYGDQLLRARDHLQRSVAIDPRYAPALAALSDTFHRAWIVRSSHPSVVGEFQQQTVSDRALAIAQSAASVDPYLAEAHTQLGWVLHWRYRRAEALAEFERAAELNPNLADGRFTLLLAHAGRADEGLAYMKRVVRLDPFHRPMYYSYAANACYLAGRYEGALEASRVAVDRVPGVYQASVWHAASAGQLDLLDEARGAVQRSLQLRPGLTITGFLSYIRLSRQQDSSSLAAGLRKAGLAA